MHAVSLACDGTQQLILDCGAKSACAWAAGCVVFEQASEARAAAAPTQPAAHTQSKPTPPHRIIVFVALLATGSCPHIASVVPPG